MSHLYVSPRWLITKTKWEGISYWSGDITANHFHWTPVNYAEQEWNEIRAFHTGDLYGNQHLYRKLKRSDK